MNVQQIEGPRTDDVLAVAAEVWTSFVSAEEPLIPMDPEPGEVAYSATVTISGVWNGAVTLEFGAGTAESVSARMLGLDDASETDVADAAGELVNMIGGNIKSLMPGPNSLSLPVVSTGHVARGTEAMETTRLDLRWANLPLSISVHLIND